MASEVEPPFVLFLLLKNKGWLRSPQPNMRNCGACRGSRVPE